jgi:hypothetical protein
MAGLTSLDAFFNTEVKWTATNAYQTGGGYNPSSNPGDLKKSSEVGTAAANGAAGGADQFFTVQQTINAGSSATFDLYALANVFGQATLNVARVKGGFNFRLLSGTDDSTISPTPNANSKAHLTNNGPALPAELYFGNGGSGLTLALTTGAGAVTSVAIGAAGSAYPPSKTFLVAPVQAGGSGAVIAVTTNSSGVPTTAVLVAGAGGTGYTNATVPTVVLGQVTLTTGNSYLYADVTAAGAILDATHRNVTVYNLDGANAITVQLSYAAGTT